MIEFKSELKKVRDQLGIIQENVSDVDTSFYTKSYQSIEKQEELVQVELALKKL